MTTERRNSLKVAGRALTGAADHKLALPENIAKGDGWDDMSLFDLVALLDGELTEFRHCAYVLDADEFKGVPTENWKRALALEGGDIINCLRFICSKYGAI